MRVVIITAVSLLIFCNFSSSQTIQAAQERNPFSGTLNITVEGGTTYSLTDYSKIGVDYFGKTSLEYYVSSNTISTLGFSLFGGGGYISGSDNNKTPDYFRTEIYYIGSGLVYNIAFSSKFCMYLFTGMSRLYFNPKGRDGKKLANNLANKYDRSEWGYNIESGFRIKATNNLSINLSGGILLSQKDNLDDLQSGKSNDMFLTSSVGLTYSMFGFQDADGDGVEDSKDMCPGTPEGIQVDGFGCPLDSDKDGVPDYADKCSGTPKGVKVDKEGCPLDSDNDGIPDYTDLCPNTPIGIAVDEYGCPFDHDADGVPDYLDKCPNTPAGAGVDEKGCPLDSDLDGVPDYLDKCPNTEHGVIVDFSGCPAVKKDESKNEGLKKEETKREVVLTAATSFEFGKTNLLPSAYARLGQLVTEMKEFPNSEWMIEGHTDNIGSEAMNEFISLERAKSVLNYFISKGISKTRFTITGMGEKNPVTDNNTEKGRAKNRRVVILRIK